MINFTPTISHLKMLAALRGNLWMIHDAPAVELALSALQMSERTSVNGEYSDEYLSNYYTLRQKANIDADGIGHIEIRGALLKECQPLYERIGLSVRYSTISSEIELMASGGAKAIMFSVNSPGGTVSGCVETAEQIAGLPIPTMSYCDGLACSAAYKLSAGTKIIAASKSAIVGNIGTILSWSDASEFWKKWGVNFKAIVSENSDLKSTFHLEPDETQLAFLQESVNESGKAFRDHVTAGREKAGITLDPEVWRAGWYSGERAMSLGLIDAIGSKEEARQYLISTLFDIRNPKSKQLP